MRQISKYSIGILILLIIGSCNRSVRNFTVQVQPDGSKMILGEIERDSLFKYFPDWEFEYKYYQPDPVVLDSLEKINYPVSVEIFLGTWCGDSRREVPHFFKIIDDIEQNPINDIKIWAVNREKEIPESDITFKKRIERVATFIFYDREKELGRIVEQPLHLFESDMLQILAKPQDRLIQ